MKNYEKIMVNPLWMNYRCKAGNGRDYNKYVKVIVSCLIGPSEGGSSGGKQRRKQRMQQQRIAWAKLVGNDPVPGCRYSIKISEARKLNLPLK
jgi:hypothetical protein